jgi:hypothetical protein
MLQELHTLQQQFIPAEIKYGEITVTNILLHHPHALQDMYLIVVMENVKLKLVRENMFVPVRDVIVHVAIKQCVIGLEIRLPQLIRRV